jgi:hypothetical protein
VKSLLAQFALYALASFAVGVAVGWLWQRRPIRLSEDRARRLEQVQRSMEARLSQSERDCASARNEVLELSKSHAVVAALRTEMADVVAERQAALAARDSAQSRVAQLRSDLDARPLQVFSAVTAEDLQRKHSSELAEVRAAHRRERDADAAARFETMQNTENQLATVQEQLRSAETHIANLRTLHANHVRSSQQELTAALLRAEIAEAQLVSPPSTTPGLRGGVIDLRSAELARTAKPPTP